MLAKVELQPFGGPKLLTANFALETHRSKISPCRNAVYSTMVGSQGSSTASGELALRTRKGSVLAFLLLVAEKNPTGRNRLLIVAPLEQQGFLALLPGSKASFGESPGPDFGKMRLGTETVICGLRTASCCFRATPNGRQGLPEPIPRSEPKLLNGVA